MSTAAGISGMSGSRIDLSARLKEWRRLLLDTSKRNRLINSKFGRGGVVAIEHPDFYPLWDLLAVHNQAAEFPWPSRWIDVDQLDNPGLEIEGQPRAIKGMLLPQQLQSIKDSPELHRDNLLTNLADRPLDGRLKRLALAASTSLSEQGVNSLFLAFGFLKWFESADSDVAILSPLVLMPVSLRKESADSTWMISPIDDDLVSNHPLNELLRADFRLDLPQFQEEQLWESAEALRSYFAWVEKAVIDHDRWQVQLTAGLGTFAFQKISMWQDLGKNEAKIVSHPLCRGIAGDSSQMPAGDATDILHSDLDLAVPPEASDLVRDCDGSQLAAIEVVQRGHHLILDGPPGTGKSQTITNIIARCLANSKTVLFVSEKSAALEVVKRRLDEAKLGDFCLECHSHKANKRAVVEELGRSLNRPAEVYLSRDDKTSELRRTRQKLNDYVRALHVKRSAMNLTAYQVHGHLARIRTASVTRTPISGVHLVDRNRLQEMEEATARLAGCGVIIQAKGLHPWRGCRTELYRLTLPDDVRFHFERAATGLKAKLIAAAPLESHGFLRQSPTIADIPAAADVVSAVLRYPRVPPSWVEAGLSQTAGRYLALNDLAENYRILCSSLTEFRGDAHLRADLSLAARVSAASGRLRVALPDLPTSLRERIAYLQNLDGRLQDLIEKAEKLQATSEKLGDVLRLEQVPAQTADDLASLATRALSIGNLGQCNPQWFEPAERKRLRQVAADASQIAAMAKTTRLPLQSKFLPSAFASIALEQVDAILRHRSWLRRMGGSWRRAKQSFLPIYSVPIPTRAREIVDDALQLKRFHQYESQLRATAEPDREQLGWDGTIDFDWNAPLGCLDKIGSLPAGLQASNSLRSIAVAPESRPRIELITAAQEVLDIHKSFLVAITGVTEAPANWSALAGGNPMDQPPSTLKAAATEFQRACREHLTQTSAILPLIESGRDVAVDSLANEFATLAELRSAAAQAGELASRLGETLLEPESRSLGDWTAPANLATRVLAFVKQHGEAPPQHLIRAISDDGVLRTLSAAIENLKSIDTPAVRESLHFVESLFSQADEISTGIILGRASASEFIEWLELRVRDADRISEWVSYVSACDNLRQLDLSTLRDEVSNGHVQPDEAVNVLRQRFYRLWLDEAYRGEPALGEFDLARHDQTVSRFREADRFWVKNGFAQVRSRILANGGRVAALDGAAPDNSELGILLREVHKRKRHLPLRRLFGSISSLLLKLKPCVMMSPLAVSTYFDNCEIRFDVVIFDEAS